MRPSHINRGAIAGPIAPAASHLLAPQKNNIHSEFKTKPDEFFLTKWRDKMRAMKVQAWQLTEQPHLRAPIARQAIVEKSGSVFGYELLYRSFETDELTSGISGDIATSISLSRAILALGLADEIGDVPLFVNVDTSTLLSPVVEAISPHIGVIELIETIEVNDAVIHRVADLKRRGYRFSLDNVSSMMDARWGLIDYVEFIKIDVHQTRPEYIDLLVARAKQARKFVLAGKIEDQDCLHAAVEAGFDLFQGYITGEPEQLDVFQLPACSRTVLDRVKRLLAEGSSPEAIAIIIGRDPATVFHLWLLSGVYQDEWLTELSNIAGIIRSIPRNALNGWVSVLLLENSNNINEEFSLKAYRSARIMQLIDQRIDVRNFALTNETHFSGLLTHFKETLKASFVQSERENRIEKCLMQSRKSIFGDHAKILNFVSSLYDVSSNNQHPLLVEYFGLQYFMSDILDDADRWARERQRIFSGLNAVSRDS